MSGDTAGGLWRASGASSGHTYSARPAAYTRADADPTDVTAYALSAYSHL